MSGRERAPARCCLQSFIAFEHHGVELRQHAHTTCSLRGCLSTGQSSGGKDPAAACPSLSPRRLLQDVPSCAVVRVSRVSCSPHRPCLVPFLAPSQHGETALHYAAMSGHVAAMELLLAHGADPMAKDMVRAPLGSLMAGGGRREERGNHAFTYNLRSDRWCQRSETSDLERAPARCCMQNLSAFEHHGVELRQHAHTTCSLPGCLSTGQSSGGKDPASACPSPSPRRSLLDVPSCAVLRVSRAHCIARALSPSLPPRRMAGRPSISLRKTAMWRRWSSSWPTAPTRWPKTWYAHHSEA